MAQVEVTRSLTHEQRAQVDTFLADVHSRLGDHLLADLVHGPRPGFVAALAFGPDDTLDGYAQASAGNDGAVVDVLTRPGLDDTRRTLLTALLERLPGDIAVTWWSHTVDADRPLAGTLGMLPDRSLLQMRCPLPLPDDGRAPVATRAFVPDVDEAPFLEVNNAAFEWHGEQGGWTLDTVRQREREPWFRPEGFLLHERDGRLAAFCWTKLHDRGRVGEIYVIAVHPDFHGLGLGRALTVAGLRHLAAAGATEGMLYVDAGNVATVTLYEHLGFVCTRVDQSFRRPPR